MIGPCITYSGKLILPRYCIGAQQKTLSLKNLKLHVLQTINDAPTVGQKRCFSLKLAGIHLLSVM